MELINCLGTFLTFNFLGTEAGLGLALSLILLSEIDKPALTCVKNS